MKKRMIYLFLMLMLISGCIRQPELKDVAVVAGVGIDAKGKDQYEVTTQTIKPGDMKKGKAKPFSVQSSTGYTIFEAIRDFVITQGKKHTWMHVEAFILGEDIARKGIHPVIDFMMRDHEPRFRMNVFVTEGKAKDLLQLESNADSVPAMMMNEQIESHASLAKAPDVEFHNFMERYIEPFQDPYLPLIHQKDKKFEIFGTAIFKGEKMVGTLTPRETRGMLRVLGEVKGGLQIVKLIGKDGKPNYISIEIKKSKAKIKAILEEKPKMMIQIKETGFIGSITQPLVLDEAEIKKIEERYAETVKKEVEHTVEIIQKKYKSQIFNFAGIINRKDKKYWNKIEKEWEDLYPNIEVIVEVETNIPENGLINRSLPIR